MLPWCQVVACVTSSKFQGQEQSELIDTFSVGHMQSRHIPVDASSPSTLLVFSSNRSPVTWAVGPILGDFSPDCGIWRDYLRFRDHLFLMWFPKLTCKSRFASFDICTGFLYLPSFVGWLSISSNLSCITCYSTDMSRVIVSRAGREPNEAVFSLPLV